MDLQFSKLFSQAADVGDTVPIRPVSAPKHFEEYVSGHRGQDVFSRIQGRECIDCPAIVELDDQLLKSEIRIFGVSPQHRAALAEAAAILVVAALFAVLVPTRRAAAVDASHLRRT